MVNNDPAFLATANLLFGYANRREENLRHHGLRVAHYTTADVAAQILLKGNVWLRNASSMNDFSEVAFGRTSLEVGLRKNGQRLKAALDEAYPGVFEAVFDRVKRADFNHQQHTYLTSLCEHSPFDEMGLLSMWRAYGGPIAGVALVLSSDIINVDSSELAAWSSPVIYGEQNYLTEFELLVASLEQNIATLKMVSKTDLENLAFNAVQFSILSTKHLAFQEEREWRIIHLPREIPSKWITHSFESVRGKPEVVYHLPLRAPPGLKLPELDIGRLLHRVVIGPCQNPFQVASTFEDILRSLGFRNPDSYIKLSLIPLRQQG